MRLASLIRWELRKSLANRLILFLLAAVFVANGLFLLGEVRSEDENGVSVVSVSSFYQEHRGASPEELLEALEDAPRALQLSLGEEIGQLADYDEYLTGVETQAERIFSSSVLAAPGTYSYRLAEKTLHVYRQLDGLEMTATDPTGVRILTESSLPLWLSLFLVILIGVQTFVPEIQDDRLLLLRSTKNGKWGLLAAKVLALLFTTVALFLLVWLENALVCLACGLSFGDLSAPMQSVGGYLEGSYSVCVLGYLGLCFGVQLLLGIAIGLLTAALCLLFGNAVAVWVVAALAGILEYVLYRAVSVHNPLAVFHQVNLFSVGNVSSWFAQFQCVNWFGFPVLLLPLSVAVIGFFCALFALCSALLWNRPTLHMGVSPPGRLRPAFRRHRSWRTSLFLHEGRKILRECNGLLLLLIVIAVQLVYYWNLSPETSRSKIYYQQYSAVLAGELTDEKSAYVAEEREFYDTLDEQIQDYYRQSEDGAMTSAYAGYEASRLEEEYERIVGFTPAEAQYRYLEEQENLGYDVTFLDTTDFDLLLGSRTDDWVTTAVLLTFIILAFHDVFSVERRCHMNLVLACTPRGRRRAVRSKIAVSVLIVTVAFLLCWGWKWVRVAQMGDLSGWTCGAHSLLPFALAPQGFSVLGWYLTVMAVRYVSSLAVLAIVLFLSRVIASPIATMAISLVGFVLPVLFAVAGLTGEAPWVTVLSGHILLTM